MYLFSFWPAGYNPSVYWPDYYWIETYWDVPPSLAPTDRTLNASLISHTLTIPDNIFTLFLKRND